MVATTTVGAGVLVAGSEVSSVLGVGKVSAVTGAGDAAVSETVGVGWGLGGVVSVGVEGLVDAEPVGSGVVGAGAAGVGVAPVEGAAVGVMVVGLVSDEDAGSDGTGTSDGCVFGALICGVTPAVSVEAGSGCVCSDGDSGFMTDYN